MQQAAESDRSIIWLEGLPDGHQPENDRSCLSSRRFCPLTRSRPPGMIARGATALTQQRLGLSDQGIRFSRTCIDLVIQLWQFKPRKPQKSGYATMVLIHNFTANFRWKKSCVWLVARQLRVNVGNTTSDLCDRSLDSRQKRPKL